MVINLYEILHIRFLYVLFGISKVLEGLVCIMTLGFINKSTWSATLSNRIYRWHQMYKIAKQLAEK